MARLTPSLIRALTRPVLLAAALLLAGLLGLAVPASRSLAAGPPASGDRDRGHAVQVDGLGVIRRTADPVRRARVIQVPGSSLLLVLWEEEPPAGPTVPYFALSPDGRSVAALQATSYDLLLRYARFDPLANPPAVPEHLAARASSSIHIVQFVTQPLEEFRAEIRALGGMIYKFLANHAYLVKMSPSVRDRVAALPFVRWVGPYHPAYRLEEPVLAGLDRGAPALPDTRYNVQLFDRGAAPQTDVARRIQGLGGVVHASYPEGALLEATLSAGMLMAVAHMDEVLFVDRWGPPEPDMNIVREVGGANFLESTAGFTGAGVRGEVLDENVLQWHVDFRNPPILFNGLHSGSTSHGTSTYGIVFGDGTGNPQARGMLPGGQGIFGSYNWMFDRYRHTARLLQPPFEAVFQSNSWGSSLTTQYTTLSAQMDLILFDLDILVTQSQSNAGNQSSRPQAWAKNIVAVGGIRHFNTATVADDCWCGGASIGPAADGRIKPDLAHFYDAVLTTTSGGLRSYTTGFGGTSAATPITAGHFGLFFEMWHNGIFGNPTGSTVFESRPHMTTAKAMLINTARQWSFAGLDSDLTRTHQGWGMANLENLYTLRSNLLVVDETDVLANLESTVYTVEVPAGGAPLRVTLVYKDPPGTTSSTQHRINDLTLKVTSPTGQVYWGNHGLLSGNWSTPGGAANTIDTVENVFVESAPAGQWTIEVIASEINEDGHPGTPEVDADYALVVSGIAPAIWPGRP